jgi:metal-responsive CopG/Arc/MetJ family transcriptional regulator
VKNVHIPDELLNELARLAEAQGTTVDELVATAVRTFLEHKALDALAIRGRIYAERAGNPDPVQAVRDARRGA